MDRRYILIAPRDAIMPAERSGRETVFKPLPVLRALVVFSSLLLGTLAGAARAQGIALGGVGPVNRAMAGAATAAPVDAAGAILWNPATLDGLESSEMTLGLELLLPTERLSSTIQPGALGGGFPPIPLTGFDRGEPGVSPIPTMAWAHRVHDSRWSYGLGMFGIAGFRVNYPASLTNPVLTPPPPNGLGLGQISAGADYLQVLPTVSYALTDRLSIGFSPTITLARLTADPLVFVAPDDADGDGFATYPSGNGTRYDWGGGFHVGAYYVTDDCWHLGCSFKSRQWFEPIRVNTSDELGRPRQESVHFDYPMILSLGTAYSGYKNWLFACDVRYFDYSGTPGFGDPAAFDAAGRVIGLGWNSVFSVHTAAQWRATERLYLRGGYQFNDNPIDSSESFFNVASPLIIQHIVSVGLSYHFTGNVLGSLAYIHGFENESSGPLQLPGIGPLAGTSVRSRVSADAIAAGVTVLY